MYRDQKHKRNVYPESINPDYQMGAKFSDWLGMSVGTATIRIKLFMSLQSTWVGHQTTGQQYLQHVWVAALRPAGRNIKGN